MWIELIKKIELQSVLILFTTLLFGTILVCNADTGGLPALILGSILIGVGILFTVGSYFSNQIRENYKDIIAEYKITIETLRSSHSGIEKSYQEAMDTQTSPQTIGKNYTTLPGNLGTKIE